MNGKFAISREILTHDLWLSEKFTRGQAWVDLIGLATYKEGYIRVRGLRVELKRGDVGWSKKRLAERWKWDRRTVDRFLNELKNDKRIHTRIHNNITTVISIINYDLYQSFAHQNAHQSPHQKRTRIHTNNKVKKVNKVKNEYSSLNKIDKQVKKEIASKYQIPMAFVESKVDDIRSYCEAHGKRYKNYKAVLDSWVKKDAPKKVVKKIEKYKPITEEISPQQRQKNLEKIKGLKEKFGML